MSEVHFLGVPFNSDGTPPEVENPPRHLRAAGLLDRLRVSRPVHDRGDLTIPPAEGAVDPHTGVLNWTSWQAVTESVAHSVRDILAAGAWPLVIGGDCSILVGIIAGVAAVERRYGLYFADAHGDFHTPASSPTGEPADMELAALTGRAPCPAATELPAHVADADIVVFGIREWDGIDATPIKVLDHASLAGEGLAAKVRAAAEDLGDRPVWLHFDVDVIDQELMPVIYPAGSGLSFDEAATLLATLLESGRLIGMDVACFHPNLDHTGTATAGLVELLSELLAI